MFRPVKLIDIELTRPVKHIQGLDGYGGVQALARLHGYPVGLVKLPCTGPELSACTLAEAVLEALREPIRLRLLEYGRFCRPEELRLEDLYDLPPLSTGPAGITITAAVCTRDRAQDLRLCLESLSCLEYTPLEILVVDNAPGSADTWKMVETDFPHVRYLREPRPGLDWARNRAILEARGDVIAFTDDDVVVDAGWTLALARLFQDNPEVMAATGLVVPYELESEPQMLFEKYGGFGRGFERRWRQAGSPPNPGAAKYYGGSGQYGTGANMAFRRSLFGQVGLFDPALDVGTLTHGGGDLEMFFRVLKEGYTLVYEPAAIVRHRHRRAYEQLRRQIKNNGIGFFSHLVRSAQRYPDERIAAARLGLWWLWWWNIRRLLLSFTAGGRFPKGLILAELWGSTLGLLRYPRARRRAAALERAYGPLEAVAIQKPGLPLPEPAKKVAVRTVELDEPLRALEDISDYRAVWVYATLKGRLLGGIPVRHEGWPVGVARLRRAILAEVGDRLVEAMLPEKRSAKAGAGLSNGAVVSIVLATRDRPDDLRRCLRSLRAQRTRHPVEVVVVDNHPATGQARAAAAEYPGVVWVEEPRRGLSYARNAGIAASQGEIIIAVDDDVVMDAGWLENLIAPFERSEVMIVAGNILPLELESEAQYLFEVYGGLGRGFSALEADSRWFHTFRFQSVPTWRLGATANVAFRAGLFADPRVGLLDEALGVGTPTGCSEDTYLFYKALKAGYTILYNPQAHVWHRHRQDIRALKRQIYGYSKGHVAYQLRTLIKDGDLRALARLGYELPRVYLWRIKEILLGRSDYPLSFTLLEAAGNLAGPWALWQSLRRVKRLGRSTPYVLPERRKQTLPEPEQDASTGTSTSSTRPRPPWPVTHS